MEVPLIVIIFSCYNYLQAVLEQGSDIVIVGRGIYTSADPVETAKLFREKAYEAYVKRCNKKSSE